MNPKIRVERAEAVPDDASVRHYDELDSGAKRELSTLVSGERSEQFVDTETAGEFSDGEFVKFTGYYRVLVA